MFWLKIGPPPPSARRASSHARLEPARPLVDQEQRAPVDVEDLEDEIQDPAEEGVDVVGDGQQLGDLDEDGQALCRLRRLVARGAGRGAPPSFARVPKTSAQVAGRRRRPRDVRLGRVDAEEQVEVAERDRVAVA